MALSITPPRRARPAGFTLVELLVVIGIVVLLIAFLLPSVGRVRRMALGTVCLSNLRQLQAAYTTYTDGNRGKGPAFTFSSSDSWVQAFRDQLKVSQEMYFCPVVSGAVSGDFGSAQSSWTLTLEPPGGAGDPAKISGSYGFNAWLLRWEPKGKGGEEFSGGTAERHVPISSKAAESVPVFADATWTDGWPRAEDPTPPDLTGGDRANQGPEKAPKENMMARFTIARHDRAVNVAFLDGHAERVRLDGLKRLQWHRFYVPRDWDPPLPPR